MTNILEFPVQTLINDIPGMLRQTARQIEDGEISADSALFIIPRPGDYPDIYGWGDVDDSMGIIGLLEIAKQFFVVNEVERK